MGDQFGEGQGPELPPGQARTPFAPVCTVSALNSKAHLCCVLAPGQSEPKPAIWSAAESHSCLPFLFLLCMDFSFLF